MFKQFAIARFMISFITFVLTYMVVTLSYDNFFKFLTAVMFILSMYVMYEAQKGRQEELARKDREWEDKFNELQAELDQKEAECQFLIQSILKANEIKE